MSSDMWRRFVQLGASDVSKTLLSGQKPGTTKYMAKRGTPQELNPKFSTYSFNKRILHIRMCC